MRNFCKVFVLMATVFALFLLARNLVYRQLAPAPEYHNDNKQYIEDIGELISVVKNSLSMPEIDRGYYSGIARLSVYLKLNKISEEDYDVDLRRLVLSYEPRFVSYCVERVFKSQKWDVDKLSELRDQAVFLRDMRYNGTGSKIITNDGNLTAVIGTIDKYSVARTEIAKGGYISSIADAKVRIKRIDECLKDKYLSGYKSVRNSLLRLKKNIGKSHYLYLASEVESLKRFSNYSESQYDKAYSATKNHINEYNSEAASLYGTKENIGSLLSDMSLLEQQAKNYYYTRGSNMSSYGYY